MATIRVFDHKIEFGTQQAVDRPRRGHDFINALPLEIGVAERGVDEERPRGDGASQLVKIERNSLEPVLVVQERGHVSLARPALDVAVHVMAEGIESAARNDGLDAGFKHSREGRRRQAGTREPGSET